jgi:hypothetical protein
LTGLDALRSFNFSQLMDRLSTPSSPCRHLGLCLTVCAMNCPFRYRDGAVIFLVVGDLLHEEKLVALAVNLCKDICGNHICLILFMSSVFELDLVFTSVARGSVPPCS